MHKRRNGGKNYYYVAFGESSLRVWCAQCRRDFTVEPQKFG